MLKVSCIIPVYNSERYLNMCMDSLMKQTLQEIEFIYVNDCSSDKSLDILQEKQKYDKRISIVNCLEHKGAASCRNIGFSQAKGQYVIFLDSDDYFYNNMLEETYYEAIKREADLLVFSYEEARIGVENGNKDKVIRCVVNKKNNCEYFHCEINKNILKEVGTAPWNKLINKKMLIENKIQFQEIPNANDVFFSLLVSLKAKKIIFSDKVLLRYYCGSQGSLTSARSNKKNYLIEAYSYLVRNIASDSESNKLLPYVLNYVLEGLERFFASSNCSDAVKEDAYRRLREDLSLNQVILENLEQKILERHNFNFAKSLVSGHAIVNKNEFLYYLDGLAPLLEQAKRNNQRIALWGCGIIGKRFIDMLISENREIDFVIDKDVKKQGTTYKLYHIYSYADIKDKIDVIFVLNSNIFNEVQEVAGDKIVVDINSVC